MHALVLGLVTLCAAAGAAPAAAPQAATEEAWTTASAQQVYDSLPEQEREPFLAYELALGLEQAAQKGLVVRTGQDSAPLAQQLHDAYGIPDNLRRKFEKLPIPHDFHINMYGWVKKSTDPTFEEMMQLAARGHYCIRDTCFTLQEPFGNCCPF